MYFCVNTVNVIKSCPTLCNPVDCRPPGPLSIGVSHWNGLAFSLPGDLPDPGIEPAPHRSPALQAIA